MSCNKICSQLLHIIFVFNLSLRFISWFGRFHEVFSLKGGNMRVPLPLRRNRPENYLQNLGKALGEGLGLLCRHFTLSIPFNSLSLSLLSLPSSLYLSFYLSFSLFPSLSLLSIILFGISNGRFCPCFINNQELFHQT